MERQFFGRPPGTVAPDLLGHDLVHGEMRGRIVETEAYRGADDPASHAANGRTARNAPMFGEPGTAYVYVAYGIHTMLNVVTGEAGEPSAVLIRAVEPGDGVDRMRENRDADDLTELCSGPGKLCEAFDISTADNGSDLLDGDLRIAPGGGIDDGAVVVDTRIGVSG
ncbi:MAG: DNA-3-methyladenine glycosylase, partial [Candidatus Nanohaloarchaea archaeon]